MKSNHAMPFGATLAGDGTRFRLWAPGVAKVELGLGRGNDVAWRAMDAADDGWHALHAPDVRASEHYRYRIDGKLTVPDPASRFNPGDVHGASEVIDPASFDWPDDGWRGKPWHTAVVYELHVGTFSPEGTYAGVVARLDHLVSLGVTAIELMPLADFPGRRNWGYDGVLPFAPDAQYGRPEALKALVAAAHARGLMVLLDVVYNHFGPEGNYLPALAPPFFTDRHRTPWGAGINYDGDGSRVVRDFVIHNALYWLEEFHVDGLRLDAVHAIADDSSPDILTELAERVHAGPGRTREVHLVLENDRNEARRLVRDDRGRPRYFTAQWNDDFHHVMHHLLTGESAGYYADYSKEPIGQLGRCLAQGFAYQGEPSGFRKGERRGEPSAQLPPQAFVNFLQNHDQVGNRAFGDRLHALAPAHALRTALAVVLLAPSPPLLFMGEEFGAASPFLFFCDFGPDLAKAVVEGRRAEFAGFPPFDDPQAVQSIPDPGAEHAFASSHLDWSAPPQRDHAQWLALYRSLLALRAHAIAPLVPHLAPGTAAWTTYGDRALEVRWPLAAGGALVLRASLGASPGAPAMPPPGASAETLHEQREADGWWATWLRVAE